jgi:hypothetical protein
LAWQDEREVVMMPHSPYEYTLKSQGGTVRIELGLYNGMSRDLVFDGPGKCDGVGQSIVIIGVSTYGNTLVHLKCDLNAGQHVLHVDSAGSAFRGVLRIDGAQFVG